MLQKLASPPLNSCFGTLCCVLFDGIFFLFCNCVLSCVASFYNNTAFFTKTSIATSSSSLKLKLLKGKVSQHSFLVGCNFLFHFACVFLVKIVIFCLKVVSCVVGFIIASFKLTLFWWFKHQWRNDKMFTFL
jgi:protein-S-isoprenylcysteine O-methyltransferase Ste14